METNKAISDEILVSGEKASNQRVEVGLGLQQAVAVVPNQASFAIQSLANDISNIDLQNAGQQKEQRPEKQKNNSEQIRQTNVNQEIGKEDSVKYRMDQNYQGELSQLQQNKTKQLEQLRVKELQLLEQLKNIRLKQKQLLGSQDSPSNQQQSPSENEFNQLSNNQAQQESQEEQDVKNEERENEEEEPEYIFSSKVHQALTLSPVKVRRKYFNEKKKKLNQINGFSQPVTPQINREEFQKKVREIAELIRSKVQKTGNQNLREERQHKGIKIELPEIKRKFLVKNSKIKEKDQPFLIQFPQKQIPEKKKKKTLEIVQACQTNEQQRKMNSVKFILDIIMKKAFDIIAYKEKYPIKLDPTKYRYPLTSFRKKVIEEERREKEKRYMSESLRVSTLHQRKQILNKTNNK